MTVFEWGGPSRADEKNLIRRQILAARRGLSPSLAARDARVIDLCAGRDAVALYVSAGFEPDTRVLISRLTDVGVRVLLPVLGGVSSGVSSGSSRRRHLGSDVSRPGATGVTAPVRGVSSGSSSGVSSGDCQPAASGTGATDLSKSGASRPQWGWFTAWSDLVPGWRGIPGPKTADGHLASVSLVFAAGLAATLAGDRLGTGGGWYDRALGDCQAPVAVLLNDSEVVSSVPTEPWDRPIDLIVTESRTIWVSSYNS